MQRTPASLITGRRTKAPRFYQSPIHLPPGKSGDFEVAHVFKSGEVPIIGWRQGLLRGKRPTMAKVHMLRVTQLLEEGGVWMTDQPEELQQIAEAIVEAKPKGSVLIGGLGLGILATVVAQLPGVDRVVVVEQSPDVIKLCSPRLSNVAVVEADIDAYLLGCNRTRTSFDTHMLDTWRGTSESTWWEEVMPLRRRIRNGPAARSARVWCWAEDIMLGQCMRAAVGQGGRNWYYRALPFDPDRREIVRFFTTVGSNAWEKRYGQRLDECIASQSRRGA